MDQKKQAQPKIIFKPSFIQRISMLLTYGLSLVLFILFIFKMIHYTFYPLRSVFPTSSSLMFSFERQPHYFYNGILYSLFFVQHVVMASSSLKKTVISFVHNYYLYERYVYNIMSSWSYLLILDFARPLATPEDIILRFPPMISIVFTILGLIILGSAMLKLGGIFNPFPLTKIVKGQILYHPGYDAKSEQGLVDTGIYSLCRHPMQGSVCLLLLFVTNAYTIDRLVFIGVHIAGIMIGVTMQQKRLCLKFKNYVAYKEKVRYKLIPYLY